MANRQKKILNELAAKHGLTIGQAEEVWKLLTDKVATTISDLDKKNEDDTYDIDKFKTISISNFGKFIPHKKFIINANRWIRKRNKNKDEKRNKTE